MFTLVRRLCLCLAVVGVVSPPVLAASPAYQPLLDKLSRAAPGLNKQALAHAVAAMQCALNNGAEPARRLAVIDYSQPSSARRLWIFDLQRNRLLLRDFVAHGRQSGENLATRFSNSDGSHQSSLGLFRTAESYQGKHGYSLRMDGLEPGINDRARERAIVIHSAAYVDPRLVRSQGRIGRSLGCPAVRPEVGRMVVDQLKGGQFMFSWYPDRRWLQSSAYLNCKPRRVASILAAENAGS
ncbi:murein L,D-transpeptidase catalytic domain family protein [Pseudomonas sp. N040]|uniref:murein L,D-transpeptidase catalytic domain family protein n=1 Tax=Pseudomonas sp. N040 TaxID=2785325 RepID=UPI0018A2544A|nr:murein L,D-transpeptidase catalytic domain family protein [Pseudomonas sp. N040]MBF7730085.1 murein L,D-transpeptidase catalytic domain family protein [Pseudomonas sp. N040]MBW7013727.1 murein L,D-transpeptidase catalytic domain family protein [Pseudomonas sp. N040]